MKLNVISFNIRCANDENGHSIPERAPRLANVTSNYDAEDVIVLLSSFEVDSSGGDGSLNPNSTYDNWNWILVRTSGGKWEHVDHGY